MVYRIELSPSAFDDIDEVVDYIAVDSPENAHRWHARLFEKIDAIAAMPRACSLAPENAYCSMEVRQFIFGRYRLLFTVRDDDLLVYVLSVRHGARRFLTGEEIEDR